MLYLMIIDQIQPESFILMHHHYGIRLWISSCLSIILLPQFIIDVSSVVLVLGSTGINAITMYVIAVYKQR